MKNLEQHIRQNREELDHIEMPETDLIWQGIQQDLQEEEQKEEVQHQLRVSHRKMWWTVGLAASIAFLIGVGLTLWQTASPSNEIYFTSTPLAAVSEDLAELEQEFQQTIQAKQTALNLEKINKNNYKDIFLELKLLEEIHQEYVQDIPAFREKDQLVKTFIKYYERKIRILERLNREIEKKEYYEKNI